MITNILFLDNYVLVNLALCIGIFSFLASFFVISILCQSFQTIV